MLDVILSLSLFAVSILIGIWSRWYWSSFAAFYALAVILLALSHCACRRSIRRWAEARGWRLLRVRRSHSFVNPSPQFMLSGRGWQCYDVEASDPAGAVRQAHLVMTGYVFMLLAVEIEDGSEDDEEQP